MKSTRGTLRSTASRKTNAVASVATAGSSATGNSTNFAMINSARPRPAPSMVNYSDEDDSAKGYDENPDDSDSLTEKPSEISSTDSQGTESEHDSRSNSDPHSFVNHYANVNSTFRGTWKKQKPVSIPVPRAGTTLISSAGNSTTGRGHHGGATAGSSGQSGMVGGANSTLRATDTSGRGAVGGASMAPSSGTLGSRNSASAAANHVVSGGAVGGAVGGAIGGSAAHQLASTNPRGYSSFTESDQDGSSAVVSLNGTQIVMNNMARSRAPLPGFSSFV